MGLKHTVFASLNRDPLRPLLGLAASALAVVEDDRGWVTYDASSRNWKKRSRGGTALMPYPRGMSVERCAEFTNDVFLPHYQISPGDIVFDIGAGVGTETLPFSKMVGESGRVVAVEAHPATFATLERLCRLNDVRNVEIIHAAVMDSDHQPVMISDLPPELNYENRIGAGGIEVPSVTIKGLVSTLRLDRIDFLKMNIEGAETAALRGAGEALDLIRNAAIGCHDFLAEETGDETYRTKDEVRALLTDAGFNVIPRDGDQRPWAADYLFVNR
jgi:FkbM family methyltransferase